MHSTAIFLLAFGLMATVAMARPNRRPWSGSHHGHNDNEVGEGQHGHQWSTYRLPKEIRVPRLLAEKLGRPFPTFTAKKIFNGKYLIISPALMFKLKNAANDTDTNTTPRPTRPTRPTTEEPVETTVAPIDEESTTPDIEEVSTTTEAGEEEETTTQTPSFFRKRSFRMNDNEQLLFLED